MIGGYSSPKWWIPMTINFTCISFAQKTIYPFQQILVWNLKTVYLVATSAKQLVMKLVSFTLRTVSGGLVFVHVFYSIPFHPCFFSASSDPIEKIWENMSHTKSSLSGIGVKIQKMSQKKMFETKNNFKNKNETGKKNGQTRLKKMAGKKQEINISHLGKRKIIFKMDFSGDMLVPRRVT